jgi:hypothetical protein
VSLKVVPVDADAVWTMTISSDSPSTTRSATAADCSITGSASDLFRALWNRGDLDALSISGDRSVIELFRDSIKVRWG